MNIWHLHYDGAYDGYPSDFVVASENEDQARLMVIRYMGTRTEFSSDNGVWADEGHTDCTLVGTTIDDRTSTYIISPRI